MALVTLTDKGIPVLLRDLAHIQIGPEMRRVVADLDGEGEITGGIVVMRHGDNALQTIAAVRSKIAQLRSALPEGVEIIETYDRSALIDRAVDTLSRKLTEEVAVVALVCLLFLFHVRSALVIVISLPLGVLAAFVLMRVQGLNANIMSLGGIAIAIGAMVDAAIVMITGFPAVERATDALKLGAVDQFPFIDPPDPRQIRDGYRVSLADDGGFELRFLPPGRNPGEWRSCPPGRCRDGGCWWS